jgi:hypothetical protein
MKIRVFEDFILGMRRCAEALPDRRTGSNTSYSMPEILLSAFSVFFTQSPSFLAYQRSMEESKGRNNARSLFDVERIPTDNHIRKMLDPVEPEQLFELFDALYLTCSEQGVLKSMRAFEGTQLIALDGTRYFSSQSEHIHCPHCSTTKHKNGTTTHYHAAITPVIVSPLHSQVIALRPEFIVPQDGHDKQDCETAASKRWLQKHASFYLSESVTLLGDDLYAHQPFCRQALMHGFHFLFTCKPQSHTHLAQWVEQLVVGKELQELSVQTRNQSRRKRMSKYQWVSGAPLTESEDALKVNWFQVTITDEKGKILFHNSYITDLEITAKNVEAAVASARARWKIENENNNTLKTKGYNLEHNFGHGKEHLASLLATMNILAFLFHSFLDLHDEGFRLIRKKLVARKTFFEHVRALTYYLCFESWEGLMDFMMKGLEIGRHAPRA